MLKYAVIVLTVFVSGCAATAKRPPSPAQNIAPAEPLARPAPPNERYYIMIFGSQSCPRTARYCHSWATMVRVTEQPDGCSPVIEQHTISWMPATLNIRPWRFRVEPGVNLDLHFTIQEMLRHNERVAMWGPYETWNGMYERFLIQKAFMESGAVAYQCIDMIGEAARTGDGCDCIHAITDMDPQFGRREYRLRYYGISASRNIVRQIFARPILIHGDQTNDWLIPALGLDRYPLIHRHERSAAVEFSPDAVQAYSDRGGSPRRLRILP